MVLAGNDIKKAGYQIHTGDENYRVSGIVGYQITPDIESRTFVAGRCDCSTSLMISSFSTLAAVARFRTSGS